MLSPVTVSPELLADVLHRQKLLDADQAAAVKKEARQVPAKVRASKAFELRPFGYELVLRLGFQVPGENGQPRPLADHDVAEALARDAGMDHVRIDTLALDANLIESQISRPFARRHRMVPLSLGNGKLRVALADPYDLEAIDSYRRIAGRPLDTVVASEPEILKALNEFYGLRHSVKRAEKDLSTGIDLGNLEQLVRFKTETEIESSDQHIVNAVEFMLQHAYDTRASDVHVEPKRDKSVIRFRIDGVLHDIQEIPKVVHAAVVSRIKTMARLDIAEKRRPQDGRMKTTRSGREVELRVSSLPVAFGEKLVMRIFDPDVLVQDLAGLGFYPDELELFNEFISRPHGIILVTGPTGSGKTTTLYSALKTLATDEVNVTTIEDPIEMVHESFNQTAVQSKVGITFDSALRHILRQDPDIIMVGEIRDPDTAQYAIQAALTGHLVFSTLHTNDAASSISRLTDLGVERFLVTSTLVGAMAQRLLRKICAPLHARALPRARGGADAAADRARGQARQGAGGEGVPPVPQHRLPRAHRHLRGPADDGRDQGARRQGQRRAADQARGDAARHAHPAAVGPAQALRRRHHGRGSAAGDGPRLAVRGMEHARLPVRPHRRPLGALAARGLLAALLLGLGLAPAARADWHGRGRASGEVASLEGGALAGASVTLRLAGHADGPPTAITDGRGRWSVLGLAAGSWQILVAAEGHEPAAGTLLVPETGAAPRLRMVLRPAGEAPPVPGIEHAAPPADVAAALAAPPEAPRAGRPGAYEVAFAERAPWSGLEEVLRRAGLARESVLGVHDRALAYEIAGESFQVRVPEGEPPAPGWGLLVWVSPTAFGGPRHPAMPAALDRHRLVWAGADGAGNERPRWDRWGLALDAVWNLGRLYPIDPARVYVAGYSGGGRVASALAMLYPDVFRGGLMVMGTDWYRDLPVPDRPGTHWPAVFARPPRELLRLARERTRWVLLTGERDFNRLQTRAVDAELREDGFRHVTFLEVPGMPHLGPIPDDWLSRALAALDPRSEAGAGEGR